ncbi:hypothetical protein ACFQU1_23755 [Chelatococcus sp. GCM10030263]|uniref:hypothetical protein n=1 Tax=Chelatococcus sp. GCM10030263 TaxID=3273387 RepID=UPI0036100715
MSDQDNTEFEKAAQFDDAAFVELVTSLQGVVADPELKSLLDHLVTVAEQPAAPADEAPAPLNIAGTGERYAGAILAWMKANAIKERDSIDQNLTNLGGGLTLANQAPVIAEPVLTNADAAKDAAAYKAYYAQVEAELNKAFKFDLATSSDPKAIAWRDLRQQLADQSSEEALTKRYANGAAASASLVGDSLAGKIRDVFMQKTGLTSRINVLDSQLDRATTLLRLTGSMRSASTLMRLVGVLNSSEATEADKFRAVAEIAHNGASLGQAVLGMAIDAWPKALDQVGPGLTGTPLTPSASAGLAAAQKTQEMLKASLAKLTDAFKTQSPVQELFKPISIRNTAVTAADLAKLDALGQANASARERASGRTKALGKAAIGTLASILTVGSDVAKLTQSQGWADVGRTVTDLFGNATLFASDALKVVGNGAKAAQIVTWLGVAGAASNTVAAGFSLVESALELAENPASEQAKWNVVNAAVQVAGGIFAATMAVVCPPAALVTLLIPNFSTVGQAIEYVKLMEDYERRGLMHEYAVLNELHTEAALDASPVANWFGAVYSPAIEGAMRDKMTTQWFWDAYQERINNIFGGQFTDEEKARSGGLEQLRASTGAVELIDIIYDKEEFSWLGRDKKLFGTAMTTYTADGRDAHFDKIWRGNVMIAERNGATKDGQIDRTVLLQRNFESDEVLPAEQPIGEELRTREVEDSSFAVDGWTVTQMRTETYLQPVNAPVAKGMSVELKLDGDNLVILQASDTVVHASGESNDTYKVLDGVNYAIGDDSGDADRVIFDASADGQTFKLQGTGIEAYYGSSFDDTVIGSEGDDIFDSGATLYEGGGGDDTITLNGGDDLATVSGPAAVVSLGAGNDAAYLYALGATVDGGDDADAVYLADAVTQAVTGGTRIGDDGKVVIEVAEQQPSDGTTPSTSRMTGIESLTLTRQDDIFDIAAVAQGTGPAAEGLGLLDTGDGNDSVRSLAGDIAILTGNGNDSVIIGSEELGGAAIENVYVEVEAGNDLVTVEGNVAANIVLNGDDRIAAAGQVDGSLNVQVGSGNACVEIGTADTSLHFDKEDCGTLTVIDGQGRAAVLDEVVFDFQDWSAGELAVGMAYDAFGDACYSIATSGGEFQVDFSSDDPSRTWIEAGDEAYSMSAAVAQLTQAMAIPGTATASLTLASLAADAHQHIERPTSTPLASLSV